MICWQFEKNPSRTRTERGGVPRFVFGATPRPLSSDPGGRRTPGRGWKTPTFGGLVLGFADSPTPTSPKECAVGVSSPRLAAAPRPISRIMPGEKVLSRDARTADPQAQTTSPRVHCASQPRPGRGCPWQQSLSLLPSHPQGAGTGKRSGAGGGTDCHQREAETLVGRRRGRQEET